MSAHDMSVAELLQATSAWANGPARAFLERHETSRGYLTKFDRLRGTLVSAPPEDSELGKLNAALWALDLRHDRLVRFVFHYLGVMQHFEDEEIAASAEVEQGQIFPDGMSLVNRSYSDQAGRYESREEVLLALGEDLEKYPLPGKITLLDKVRALQAVTKEMGEMLARRNVLGGSAGPSPAEILATRRALIDLVQHVLECFTHVDLDPDSAMRVKDLKAHWERAADMAASRTRRRSKAKATTPAGESPPNQPES